MNSASTNRIEAIESWFRANDDGDFCVCPSDHASVRISGNGDAQTVVYITKNHCLSRICGLTQLHQPVATLGRCGLPVNDDLPFVRGSATSVTRMFIGDADPPDLLAFAWLREHLPIEWHGVSDEFLVRHGNLNNARIQIRLSKSEMAAVPALTKFCPDFRDLLGPYCSSLLDNGFKIELEGAIIDDANPET